MVRRSVEIPTLEHANPIPAATRSGQLGVRSGSPPYDRGTRRGPDRLEPQVEDLFAHGGGILAAAGAGWGDAARMTFYVRELATRDAINGPWVERFPDAAARPSRHTMVVAAGPAVSCDLLAYLAS